MTVGAEALGDQILATHHRGPVGGLRLPVEGQEQPGGEETGRRDYQWMDIKSREFPYHADRAMKYAGHVLSPIASSFDMAGHLNCFLSLRQPQVCATSLQVCF
jgi:hypothetical protein